jgi:Kef-type K+ transport system membrane component KefB
MTPLLSIILLFLIAYFGWLFYKRFSSKSALINHIAASGSIYLLAGFLIGPQLFGLLTEEIIENLNVLVGLVLGWTGFLIGLQAKRQELRRFQESYYLFASLNFFLMLSGSVAILFFLQRYLYPEFGWGHFTLLAIAGAVSSPILIALLRTDYRVRGHGIHLLQFSAAYDNMLGVIVFGIALILFNPILSYESMALIALIASLIFSTLMAYLFYTLSKRVINEQQFFLILVGFLLLIVGVALNINISLIFISFVFGLVLTNLPVETNRLYHSIEQAEKPLYYLMLIFVGASIQSVSTHVLYLVLVFIVLRLVLKYLAGYLARMSFISTGRPPKTIGIPHLGMGGLAVAMILDYHVSYLDEYSSSLLLVVALSMIINTMVSPRLYKRALER